MDKEVADKMHRLATEMLTDCHQNWLQEYKTIHGKATGALFMNALLYKAAVFAIDIGMPKEVYMQAIEETWTAADQKAPRFS